MHRLALLAAVVLACGDNKAIPDAPLPPADAPPVPTQVTITTFAPPDLIKYRDGSGDWADATDNGDGTFTITVTDDYLVLLACVGAGSSTDFDVEEFARTVSGDKLTQEMDCSVNNGPGSGSGSGSGSNVAITGTMKQAGDVQMGGSDSSSKTANWNYSLSVQPGTHDLLAIGDDDNVQLQRDLDLSTVTTGPTIDVDANGVADPKQTLTLNNAGSGAMVLAFDGLGTANEFLQIDQVQGGTTIRTIPAALLQANDFQFMVALALTNATEQVAQLNVMGATALPTTFDMIPVLTGITFDPPPMVTGHWGTLPASTYDDVEVQVFLQSNTQIQQQIISASQSWVDKTHATSLVFDTSAPGYKSTWVVSQPLSVFQLAATDAATGIQYISAIADLTAFKADALRARHLRHMRQVARQVRGASRKILP